MRTLLFAGSKKRKTDEVFKSYGKKALLKAQKRRLIPKKGNLTS